MWGTNAGSYSILASDLGADVIAAIDVIHG